METFEPGDAVWFLVPGGGDGSTTEPSLFYPGVVTEYHVKGNVVTIKPDPVAVDSAELKEQTHFVVENNGTYVRKRNLVTASPGGVMDMITMNDLSEPALLWNIRQRYKNGNIYTYVGSMLISVNPYKMYDNIYGLPVVKKYEGRVLGDLPPHLFALASASYTRMCKDREPQVVIISGESGSGKTECTKLILGYLALVNKSPSNLITEQILEASPLLESFGNAKTTKNDNSSRFGKYLQVFFDEASSSSIITGCRITEYLLEKSRIVTQNSCERNYHVFYELLEGLSKEQKEKYGLLTADKYFYLNQGSSSSTSNSENPLAIPGKNDADDFQALISAMQILGLSSPEIDCVFRVLASVLHLGNVYFHRKALKQGMEGVEIGSDAEIQWIAHLLEVSPEGLRKVLTSRTTESRGEKMTTPLTIDQSLDCRDAIAKILYSNLFTWLVQRVNRIVHSNNNSGSGSSVEKQRKPQRTCINILDIFGFENFKDNSFEQLCINYANESIHHFLTRHVFKLEQAEYAKEKIEWIPIDFEDNMPIISLLIKKPVGILHLLDDESNFPKGTDSSFLEKCHYNHALNENYLRQRMSSKEFGIKHYAGNVWYNTEGFLEKNRGDFASSSQQDFALRKLLCSSKEKIMARMFILGTQTDHLHSTSSHSLNSSGQGGPSGQPSPGGGGGNQHHRGHHRGPPRSRNHQQQNQQSNQNPNTRLFVTMKPRAATVSARFTSSLNSLLESMSRCSPWFIRCIKPNNDKKPNLFDTALVLDQLRYSGILETIKIRKLGYPIRYGFGNFVYRYKCIVPAAAQSQQQSTRDLTRLILTSSYSQVPGTSSSSSSASGDDFQIGSSKVFLREVLEQRLEKARYDLLNKAAKLIQATVRGHVQHKMYHSQKRAAVRIQGWIRMTTARRDFLKIQRGVTRLQATIRMRRDQRRYRAVREEIMKRNQKRKLIETAEKTAAKNQTQNYGLTGVNHLEIPAELAFILSRLDGGGGGASNSEKSPRTPGGGQNNLRRIQQSSDVSCSSGGNGGWAVLLDKFGNKPSTYKLPFQKGGHEQLKMRREPIVSPFLKTSPKEDALIIFKLILRFMNDSSLGSPSGRDRELLLQNYLVNKGIKNELIRDEILIQILNQTRQNPNRMNCERGWLLLASCLSAFQPRDENLFAYLLTHFSELKEGDDLVVEKSYKAICQLKCLQMAEEGKRGRVRSLPPFGPAELRTIDRKQHGQVFLEIDGVNERVESWMQVGEVAGRVGSKKFGKFGKNYNAEGLPFWTLDFVGAGGDNENDRGAISDRLELDSNAFIFDTNFESVDYSQFGKVFGSSDLHTQPMPTSPTLLFVRMMYAQGPHHQGIHMHKVKPMEHLNKIAALSSKSRLNERYFKAESAMPGTGGGSNSSTARTKSLDNLLDDPVELSKAAMQRKKMMGLSDSKLNQRYNSSIENLRHLPAGRKHSGGGNYFVDEFVDEEEEMEEQVDFNSEEDEEEEEEEDDDEEYEPELVAATTNKHNGPLLHGQNKPSNANGMSGGNRGMDINGNNGNNRAGPPRYIKAMSGSSRTNNNNKAPSSVGSKNFGYYGKSSAMSDTSEAPSLASHVRRVRVPSQASDVDQFLDDLFSPVLEGSNMMDDLSDVRSLVSNLKGGGVVENHPKNKSGGGVHKPANPSEYLQSAMEQNIQIQQQLIEQNQALQELLRRSSVEKLLSGGSESRENAMMMPNNNGKLNGNKQSGSSGTGSIGDIPIPPPLPPTLLGELNGHHPFMDPYGRAKTVRIGKWRWPPKNGGEGGGDDDFNEFKARLEEKRKLDQDDDMHHNNANNDDDWLEKQLPPKLRNGLGLRDRDGGPLPLKKHSAPSLSANNNNNSSSSNNSSMQINPIRNPFSDMVVGKLKLSHEMRAKLEMVTSLRVGSGGQKKSSAPHLFETQVDSHHQPKKLDENRRNVLQEKLMGSNSNLNHNGNGGRVHQHQAQLHPPPPPPMPITQGKHSELHVNTEISHHHQQHHHHMDENYDTLSQVYNQVTSPVIKGKLGSKGGNKERSSGGGGLIPPPSTKGFVDHHHQVIRGRDRDERIIEPPDYSDEYSDYEASTLKKKLKLHSTRFQNSYGYLIKRFRLRKDLISEDELKDPDLVGFLREQILRDLRNKSPRITEAERRSCANIMEGGNANIVDIARSWSLYFWRFFKVTQQTLGSRSEEMVQYVAVNDKGLKLVGVRQNKLHVFEFYSWSKIVSVLASKSSSSTTDVITITLGNGQKLSLHCDPASNLQRTCDTFFMNDVKSSKRGGDTSGGMRDGGQGGHEIRDQSSHNHHHNNNNHHHHQSSSNHHSRGPIMPHHHATNSNNNDHHAAAAHGHINMMKSATSSMMNMNNSSRAMSMGMTHHQIQSSAGGSYGDDMDSTIGLEFAEDLDEISTTPTGGGGQSHAQFSRKVAASYYDHHHHQHMDDDHMIEFQSTQNYGKTGYNNHHGQTHSGEPSPPMMLDHSSHHLHTRHTSHPDGPPRSMSMTASEDEREGRMHSGGQLENDGKHSLLQFALKYFRQKDKFQQQHPGDNKNKEDQTCWTWREQVSCVKYSPKMMQQSLLPLPSEQMNKLALECFASILKYMGDYTEHSHAKDKKHKNNNDSPPPAPLLTEVEAVYTLLRNCHLATTNPHISSSPAGSSPDSAHHPQMGGSGRPVPLLLGLADEVYCQIMKQTTNNTNQKSAQRGWRLFTILAAYFTCSDTLRPYLFKYLETNAYDKRRAFHGTALVTLQNLRKTFKYGGRRNVPSVEEITAITAGRNAKRQIFRLPGGAQRVVNVKATTVVQDVLEELCTTCLHMEGSTSEERGEWSVYCIVEGDTTMPLQREEYILDVTTELQKNAQTYYLIFCRSVWFFPLRLDAPNNDTYVDLIFNQIAPDYLEGLLLTMPGQALNQSLVYDIARIAALLHRAADLRTPPTLKETKYLLPKPALAARDMRPNQWVSLVNKYWAEEKMGDDLMRPIQAKAIVLEILQKWDLFGSSFFSVKRMADPSPPEEYILALNKNGVHFLDIITHETLNWWSYSEILSTRKVKNEDCLLYLDLKVGNLMQQRITRLQTEHAHEISRLIRQYIHIQKYQNPNPNNNTNNSQNNSPMSAK